MNSVAGKIKAVSGFIITRPLDMGDFDEVYRGASFDVWVAPTRAHLQEWAALTREIQAAKRRSKKMTEDERSEALEAWRTRQLAWYAATWRNVTLEDVREIKEALPEVAWDWLTLRTSEMIGAYRREKLGNSKGD